ncbi:endonuclease V [Tenacibaculum maritimum]|uniref:endonuclease V n=1 Tax=Tenacibaculum maritimum TaxID=107401 RepID=UPI0012E5226F|nr:endonuclease V [Tenacibaculum maritimum]CAA0228922.1 conserved hypothetical protein [Tenacibaculum maritimum]
MIYCFDTYYGDNFANTAVVGINDWGDATPSFELTEITTDIQEYESGAFYKRELPCLLSIIEKIPLNTEKDILVIDGYVFLSDDEKLGLGGYLFNELKGKTPVIGVAKNNFHTLNKLKKEVFRGQSKKPLYITTLGFDLEKASFHILNMHGEYRMPTILKDVDSLSRITSL